MSILYFPKWNTHRILCFALVSVLAFALLGIQQPERAMAADPVEQAFQGAADEFGVPENLLKALCYMEGRFSMHGGTPSIDGGYGCNLVKNSRIDTLDRAASTLGVSPTLLQQNLEANIRGAACILSEDARQLTASQMLPTDVSGWRGALELYSNARSQATAHLYANEVYTLLKQGLSTMTEQGEMITVAPQTLSIQTGQPRTLLATSGTLVSGEPAAIQRLPVGCRNDGKTDYPGAIDCIVNPAQHDCDLVPGTNAPCNYFSSNHYGRGYRQNDGTITHVVIHDIEGTGLAALDTFQDPNSNDASHYIVDSDGTIYQTVREKDVPFQAGNLWYNQHSIGIEHAGFYTTGYQWYNASEYLASAQLTAYLLQKYDIPWDHEHVVSHGTIPAPTLGTTPNHTDPGPYWLWSYYLNLVQQQLGAIHGTERTNEGLFNIHILHIRPPTARQPFGGNGKETAANFNFFYLYNGPSTKSGLIPQEGSSSDINDETDNVEAEIDYFILGQTLDPAGSGKILFAIWYGESNQAHASTQSFFEHARIAWLAVPPSAVSWGSGTIVTLRSADGQPVQVSGKPAANTTLDFHIGDAPSGATFVSNEQVFEDGTDTVWYEINYNHRQAWVPANNVIVRAQT